MNITTFQEDMLELSNFSKQLEKFIETEHDFVEGNLVVALSSKHGAGKSTFLKMWCSALEKGDGDNRVPPLVISLNAWENNHNGEPLFAIVSALSEVIEGEGQNEEILLEAARSFGRFSMGFGSQNADNSTVIGEEQDLPEEDGSIECGLDAFSMYEGRKKAMAALKAAIEDIVASSSPKALFLVDELDRCSPDYVIAFLETIKQLFDIRGAVFILAANRHQLENSVKTAFGENLDFEEYFRKFVHREVTLPRHN